MVSSSFRGMRIAFESGNQKPIHESGNHKEPIMEKEKKVEPTRRKKIMKGLYGNDMRKEEICQSSIIRGGEEEKNCS